MTLPRRFLRGASLTCLLAVTAATQTLPIAGTDTVALSQGVSVTAGPRDVVAAGATYRATFAPDGITFLPALGDRAPHDFPFGLRWLGDDHGGEVMLGCRGETVVYARGVAEERHTARADGIELSVAYARHPQGGGDLVARYRITTELPFVGSTAAGLTWRTESGGITIGGVTGIDADGRTVAGSARLVGNELELALPAAFVARAAWPVVIDPLVGTTTSFATGWVDTQSDAAWHEGLLRYLVVWRQSFSSTHSDIRGCFVTAAGAQLGSRFYVTTQQGYCLEPAVVVVNGAFWVAWQHGSSLLGPFTIEGCAVYSGATAGPVGTLSDPTENSLSPRWARATGPGSVQCVWRHPNFGLEVSAVAMDGSGTLVPFPFRSINLAVDDFDVPQTAEPTLPFVAVAGFGGGGYEYTVVRLDSASESIGLASQLPWGTLAGRVAIAMNDPTHGVIAWSQGEGVSLFVKDVYARAFHWDGVQIQMDGPARLLGGVAGANEIDPAIAALGAKYSIAWTYNDPAGATSIRGAEFRADCQPCGTAWSVAAAGSLRMQPAIAARATGGVPVGDGFVTWTEASLAAPFSGSIAGQLVQAYTGGSIVEAGQACGFAGTFDTVGGACGLGNADFALRLQGFPAGSLTFASIGFPGGEISCGLCTFTNGIAIHYVPPLSPTEARRPLPLPCDTGLIGAGPSTQWLVFGGAGAPCPAVAGLVSSRRLHLTLGD